MTEGAAALTCRVRERLPQKAMTASYESVERRRNIDSQALAQQSHVMEVVGARFVTKMALHLNISGQARQFASVDHADPFEALGWMSIASSVLQNLDAAPRCIEPHRVKVDLQPSHLDHKSSRTFVFDHFKLGSSQHLHHTI